MNQTARRERRRQFAILDRDGTINVEKHYLSHPDQLELLPGVVSGLRRLRAIGLGIVVVTNQSGIARGYFDRPRLTAIHDRLREMLRAEGVELEAIYFADDDPRKPTNRRKPGTGMLTEAAAEFGFSPSEAFVAGDKACDINMGLAANATTFLVRSGHGARTEADHTCAPHFIVDNLNGMAATVEQLVSSSDSRAA